MSNSDERPGLLERIKNVFSPRLTNNTEQLHTLRSAHDQLTSAYDVTIEAWACALELHKHGSEGHIRRVTDLTVALARKLNIGEDEIAHVRRGALLHDIGEMRVPDAILLKNGPLTAAERAVLRQHPLYAYEMLSPIEYLRPALAIPYCHHEKWDGMGYPRGLKGEEIPLAARIFAVVDTWDALRTDRFYRRAWPDEKVWQYLRDQADGEYDPAVVAAFIEIILSQRDE